MEITVLNRQRSVRLDLVWLRRFAVAALDACSAESGDGQFALRQLPEVSVAIVSDRVIARIHQDFMNVPGATDVITFDHGEIVTSADTAVVCAREHGHTTDEEVALYIVHGLLHLNGFDDLEPGARRRMHAVQNRTWKRLRKELGAAGP